MSRPQKYADQQMSNMSRRSRELTSPNIKSEIYLSSSENVDIRWITLFASHPPLIFILSECNACL